MIGVATEFIHLQVGAQADERCLAVSFQSERDRECGLKNRYRDMPVMKILHIAQP